MTESLPITFECPICNASFRFSKSDKLDAHVLCPNCGHDFGTYRDMNKKSDSVIQRIKDVTAKRLH